MSVYVDYRYDFPVSDLATALPGIEALAAALGDNFLGYPRDAAGAVTSEEPAWTGDADPTASRYYIALRSMTPLPVWFDPSAYGMAVSDPAASAAVLGIWA